MEQESKSFARIAYEQFRKNKPAIIGVFFVFILVSIAVFVPLIANNKPLIIKAVQREIYENAYYVILDALESLSAKAEAGKAIDTDYVATLKTFKLKSGVIKSNFRYNKEHLVFDEFSKTLREALQKKEATQLASLKNSFETAIYKPDTIKLAPRVFFPAIRNLSSLDIIFMISYIFFIAAILLCKDKIRFWFKIMWLSIAVGLVFGLSWKIFVPSYFDQINYKDILDSPDTAWAVFPPIPYGENENITSETKQKPGWLLPKNDKKTFRNTHWFGTDTNGRDVLTRMIYGARIAVSIGIVSVAIYVSIGIFIGSIIGYFGGWIDIVVSRIIEIVICFPILFLILSILAYVKPSIYTIMAVLGLVWWTGIARLERGEFIRLANEDFVQAVKALGGSHLRIIFKHILPNALGPILVSASFGMGTAILVESFLSFLGFGVPQPMASWGDILKNGQDDIQGAWWLTIFPGFAIFLTVTAFNLIGDGLRDATDPKLME